MRTWYAGNADALGGVAVEQPGTEFQSAAWEALRQIPSGRVHRYGEVAKGLARPGASRVVGASGNLTGFAWGVDIKRALLRRENPAS